MKKNKIHIVVVCLLCFASFFCQGQQEEKTHWWYDETTFSVSDTMVTLSSQIDMGLNRWQSEHENWVMETDSFSKTQQRMLDSVASFAKRDSNCSYVITRYGTSYWKLVNPRLSMNRAKLLRNYLVWRGVDSLSIWLAIDTIPNCQPLDFSKGCLHYYEIKKVGTRQYSGWIKERRNKCLPNAYLYGVVKNCFHRQLLKEIGRSDKDGRFVCNVPNVPISIVIKDESHTELMRFRLDEGEQIDKKIRIRSANR